MQDLAMKVPVLIAAVKAAQLPMPVKKANMHISVTLIDPGPLMYACLRGKYPEPRQMAPKRIDGLGPLKSVTNPIGIPVAYMPIFAEVPTRFCCVADSFNRSAKEGPHAE